MAAVRSTDETNLTIDFQIVSDRRDLLCSPKIVISDARRNLCRTAAAEIRSAASQEGCDRLMRSQKLKVSEQRQRANVFAPESVCHAIKFHRDFVSRLLAKVAYCDEEQTGV